MNRRRHWWKGGVIYQIYPRSFADANGDGIGDLEGITRKLDYIGRLGVDGIWISPFFRSPMKDFGYDISDYRAVDPIFGDIDGFHRLLNKAHELGLKVVIDQVLSHTSDQHRWFDESRSSRTNNKADWYVWADPNPDGSPPNNWLAMFGDSAWTWDSRRRQYYLHHFLASQPDLNFHHPDVRAAQLDNLKFWLDLGVDGFRLDVVNFYYHSANLQSNPAIADPGRKSVATAPDNPYSYQQHIYDITQPENLEFLRQIRTLVDAYPDTVLIGEISDDDSLSVMSDYTEGGDKLHSAYTFDLLTANRTADYIRQVIARVANAFKDSWACWALSNHDVMRCRTRWGQNEDGPAFSRAAVALLLSLRGTICLYQGEELGFPDSDVPLEHMRDPYGLFFWPIFKGRDGCRTPMAWDASSTGGFSTAEPWLPLDDAHRQISVEVQEQDPSSCLHAIRALIAWRQQQPALLEGELTLLSNTGETLA
ncbi:MAG: alpha-amylase family glycosyl hydrolase [Myxococcota bacterium]